MQIRVKFITKSSENKVIKLKKSKSLDAFDFKIKVTAAPEKGKANQKAIELLAKYFKISKSAIKIIHGLTISEKIIKIYNI